MEADWEGGDGGGTGGGDGVATVVATAAVGLVAARRRR